MQKNKAMFNKSHTPSESPGSSPARCASAPQAAAGTRSCGSGTGPAPLFKYLFSNFPSAFICLFENKDAPCTDLSCLCQSLDLSHVAFVPNPTPTP